MPIPLTAILILNTSEKGKDLGNLHDDALRIVRKKFTQTTGAK